MTGFILANLFWLQSCNVQDVDSSHKFTDFLPQRGQHRTPSSLLSTRMPHPSQREVCFLVLKFELDRLRRSSSSSLIDVGRIHHHACMQACRFGPTTSPAQAHLSIVQNRHIYLFLHSIFNVLAQRSHKLHGRLHTACVGTMQGPKFSNSKRMPCSSLHCPADFYPMMLSEACFETKFVAGALQAPRRCHPPAVVVLVTLLVTPQAASTSVLYLQASSNRLALTIQSPDHNRQGRDAGH